MTKNYVDIMCQLVDINRVTSMKMRIPTAILIFTMFFVVACTQGKSKSIDSPCDSLDKKVLSDIDPGARDTKMSHLLNLAKNIEGTWQANTSIMSGEDSIENLKITIPSFNEEKIQVYEYTEHYCPRITTQVSVYLEEDFKAVFNESGLLFDVVMYNNTEPAFYGSSTASVLLDSYAEGTLEILVDQEGTISGKILLYNEVENQNQESKQTIQPEVFLIENWVREDVPDTYADTYGDASI